MPFLASRPKMSIMGPLNIVSSWSYRGHFFNKDGWEIRLYTTLVIVLDNCNGEESVSLKATSFWGKWKNISLLLMLVWTWGFHMNINFFHRGYFYYSNIKKRSWNLKTWSSMNPHATIQMDKCNDGHIPTCMFGNKTNMLSYSAFLYSGKSSTNI